MPRAQVIGRQTTIFIHGTLYREGGVFVLTGKKEGHPLFNPRTMRWVSEDTPLCIEGPRNTAPRGMVAMPATPKESVRTQGEVAELVLGAVGRLEHDDDTHWTRDGLPNLTTVSEFAGVKVTHAMREELFPDVERRTGGD